MMIKFDRFSKPIPVGLENITVMTDNKPVRYKSYTIDSHTGGKMLRLQIGDPSRTISGKHLYTIKYSATRGVYPSTLKGMNAIRWNAVGSGSDVSVRLAIADIYLPSSIRKNNVLLVSYAGTYGSKEQRGDYNWIDDHHARFEVRSLLPHEAFTVEANFPKGLLEQSGDEIDGGFFGRLLSSWHWAGMVAFFLFIWRYAKRFGIDDSPGSISPQYYPPKGLSLLQSGLIIDKFADREDFSAAVLELGSLGYLKIDNISTPAVIKKTDKILQDGDLTIDQRYILESMLFSRGSIYTVDSLDRIKAERMQEKLNVLNNMLYEWGVSSGQMRSNPQLNRQNFLLRAGAVGAVLILAALLTAVKYYGIDSSIILFMATVFVSIGAFILSGSIRRRAWSGIFFAVIWLAVSLFSFGNIIIMQLGDFNSLLASPVIIAPVVVAVIWYFYKRIGIFTKKGLDTYRYLLGYKDFIQKVEKNRIKRFLKEDPLYLDRTLPYAVLFGVSKHWLKLYGELGVAQPVWYYGDMHQMDSLNHALQTQTMPPVSESGGFSGGGSFAGGGGGGGGVGSW